MHRELFPIILLIMLQAQVKAQIKLQNTAYSSTINASKSIFELSKTKNFSKPKVLYQNIDKTNHITEMPQYYCYDKLAFFCKIEVKLEKKVQYPFKFRLGSVNHVDYLEGKTRMEGRW